MADPDCSPGAKRRSGYANAQFSLGYLYDRGSGVVQNYKEAAAWYLKAAEQGDARAQFNIGLLHHRGDGVVQNYKEAAAWYRKAAEQGDAKAQFNIGVMYERGEGVAQDYKEAATWYRKAAEQGDAKAQNNLGLLYRYGRGVPENTVLAHMLYDLAASQGIGVVDSETYLFLTHPQGRIQISAYDLSISAECQGGKPLYVRAVKKVDWSWITGEDLAPVSQAEGERNIKIRSPALFD